MPSALPLNQFPRNTAFSAMTSKRTAISQLAQLIENVRHPIYVLDEDLALVYLNEACGSWLGVEPESLLGIVCKYAAEPADGTTETIAAGLCPPPTVLQGEPKCGTVFATLPDGVQRRRTARFFPLGNSASDVFGVLTVVAGEDSPIEENPTPSNVDPNAIELHDRIAAFRQEIAGRFRADAILGNSPAAALARRQTEIAVGCRCNVTIIGPTGSGRQSLAAAIHYGHLDKSKTLGVAGGNFVPLDCSTLPDELVLSTFEVIGRSSQADPQSRKTAVLVRADALSPEAQTALSEMIARRWIPYRVIATTETSLVTLSAHGAFRGDLATFLSPLSIELPSLANRREDVPLLTQVILELCNASQSKQSAGFTPEAIDRLAAYSWPGNVAELREVVVESHRNAKSREIAIEELPEKIRFAAHAAAYPRREDETVVLDEFLQRVERELIRRALARAKGNKAKAARLLGLTRPRLYRRMEELSIPM